MGKKCSGMKFRQWRFTSWCVRRSKGMPLSENEMSFWKSSTDKNCGARGGYLVVSEEGMICSMVHNACSWIASLIWRETPSLWMIMWTTRHCWTRSTEIIHWCQSRKSSKSAGSSLPWQGTGSSRLEEGDSSSPLPSLSPESGITHQQTHMGFCVGRVDVYRKIHEMGN